MTNEIPAFRFKDLPRDKKEALLIAHYLDQKHVQCWSDGRWMTKLSNDGLFPDSVYRIAPKPEIPDSIDWSAVAKDFDVLRRYHLNPPLLYNDKGHRVTADVFDSYRRGNMKNCTITLTKP